MKDESEQRTAWMGMKGSRNTVDGKTIGGNAEALLGYPTTHQILLAEEVSSEDRPVDRTCN